MFFVTAPATPEIYPLSLHDALPIFLERGGVQDEPGALAGGLHVDLLAGLQAVARRPGLRANHRRAGRSEEHTSELQSLTNLVCRLLLEQKNHTASHEAATQCATTRL